MCSHPCGFLASPNYPAIYPDSTTVTWNIHIPGVYYIRLEFIELQVESCLPVCAQDYVDVFNTLRDGSQENMGRYCIPNQPPQFLFSILNQMAIVFSSDGQYSNSGFFAQYSAERYNLPENIKEQSSQVS